LLRDRLQHVSRLGNVRQIDLGLKCFHITLGTAPRRLDRRLGLGLGAKMRADLLCFVHLDGTGMGLFLGDADQRKNIQDGFALDFQFPGQVIDTNLLHSAFYCLRFVLSVKSSFQPHGVLALAILIRFLASPEECPSRPGVPRAWSPPRHPQVVRSPRR
jgi:hypothetical protein